MLNSLRNYIITCILFHPVTSRILHKVIPFFSNSYIHTYGCHRYELGSSSEVMRPQVPREKKFMINRARNHRYRQKLKDEYNALLHNLRAFRDNHVPLNAESISISRLRRLGSLLRYRSATVENVISQLLNAHSHGASNEVSIPFINIFSDFFHFLFHS